MKLGGGGVELDRGHVAPELLETVVAASFRREDVQDDVEVVGEDPVPLRRAFDRPRPQPVVALQSPLHLVEDGVRLPWIPAGAEHEEVRVGADRPQIEDDDVLRQLLLSEAGDEASLFERGQSGTVLVAICRPKV
jgi:hypothetical protein